MKKAIVYIGIIALGISACGTPPKEEQAGQEETPAAVKVDLKSVIKEEQLASKKDPVCGMPVYKFLEDTTLYKGNIYGFCGQGCKDDFLKNPETYLHPGSADSSSTK